MNCDQAIPRLSLGAYGELDDGERHELETHLAECPRCTAEWAELQRLKMLLTPTETAAEATRRKEDEEDLLAQFRVHLSAALDSEDGLASAQPTTFTQPAAAAARHQDGHRFWSAGWPVLAAPLMSLLLIAAGFAG